MGGITIPSYNIQDQSKRDLLTKNALAFGSYKSKMIKRLDAVYSTRIINGEELYGEFDFTKGLIDNGNPEGEWLDFLGAEQDEKQDIWDALDNSIVDKVNCRWEYSQATELTEGNFGRVFERILSSIGDIAKVEIESYCKAYSVDDVLEEDRLPESFRSIFGQNLKYRLVQNTFEIPTETDAVTCQLYETANKYRISKCYASNGVEITSQKNSEALDWLLMLLTTSSSIATNESVIKGAEHILFDGPTKQYQMIQTLTEYDILLPSDFVETRWEDYQKPLLLEPYNYAKYYDRLSDLVVDDAYGLDKLGSDNHIILWATFQAEASEVISTIFVRHEVLEGIETINRLFAKKKELKKMTREQVGYVFGNFIDIRVIQDDGLWTNFKLFLAELMQNINDLFGGLIDLMYKFPIFRLQLDVLVWLVSLFTDMDKDDIRDKIKEGLAETLKAITIIIIGALSGGVGWATVAVWGTAEIISLVLDILSLVYTLYDVATKKVPEEEKETEKKEEKTEAQVTKDSKAFEDENEMRYNGQFELLSGLEKTIDKPFENGSLYNKNLNEGGM